MSLNWNSRVIPGQDVLRLVQIWMPFECLSFELFWSDLYRFTKVVCLAHLYAASWKKKRLCRLGTPITNDITFRISFNLSNLHSIIPGARSLNRITPRNKNTPPSHENETKRTTHISVEILPVIVTIQSRLPPPPPMTKGMATSPLQRLPVCANSLNRIMQFGNMAPTTKPTSIRSHFWRESDGKHFYATLVLVV